MSRRFTEREEVIKRIYTLNGIIDQLTKTRINQQLAQWDLPFAQLSVLMHCSHQPQKSHTVTELAKVMEVNQPAMTKTTQRLLKKGWLEVRQDAGDKRTKHYVITESGLDTLHQAYLTFGPDLGRFFEGWSDQDLNQLKSLLERLKQSLDDARES